MNLLNYKYNVTVWTWLSEEKIGYYVIQRSAEAKFHDFYLHGVKTVNTKFKH